MAHEYYLRVNGLTHSGAADDPQEDPAQPGRVDRGRFLHVYVAGYVPGGTERLRGKLRAVGGAQDFDLQGGELSARGYRFTVTHYSLAGGTAYLMRFADDFAEPRCLVSQVIETG